MSLLIITFGCLAAGLVARGEPAGADARAYWAAVRIWLGGGDPYRPTGPFLPYVYAPWMLPAVRAVGAPAVGRRLVRVARRDDPRPPLDDPLGLPPATARDRDSRHPARFPDRREPGHREHQPAAHPPPLGRPVQRTAPRRRDLGDRDLDEVGPGGVPAGAQTPGTPVGAAVPRPVGAAEPRDAARDDRPAGGAVGFGRRPIRLDYIVFLWALVPVLWRQPDPFAPLHPSWWRGRLEAIRGERRSRARRARGWVGLPYGSSADRRPVPAAPDTAPTPPIATAPDPVDAGEPVEAVEVG